MVKKKTVKVIIIASFFFAVGYLLSFQLHGSKNELTDEYTNKLIEKFFIDNYSSSLALDTYNLALIHQNLENDKITKENKNILKEIILYNIDLMEKSRKNNNDWSNAATKYYLKTKKMNNIFSAVENNEKQNP